MKRLQLPHHRIFLLIGIACTLLVLFIAAIKVDQSHSIYHHVSQNGNWDESQYREDRSLVHAMAMIALALIAAACYVVSGLLILAKTKGERGSKGGPLFA